MLDIEATNLNADFGTTLCVGYKWYGDKKTKLVSLDDYPDYGKSPQSLADDSKVIRDFKAILEEADMWVGWYSSGYDIKFLQTQCLFHGFGALPKTPHVDLWWWARHRLKMSSNRLARIAEHFGLGRKTSVEGRKWILAAVGHVPSLQYVKAHCPTPEMKVLTADLQWVPVGSVKTGDKLVGFDEHANTRVGYYGRRYKTAIVESCEYGKQEIVEVHMQSGKVLRVTPEHLFLPAYRGAPWTPANTLRHHENVSSSLPKIFDVWQDDTSYAGGYLSGILDGEGSLHTKHHSLAFSQRPNECLAKSLSMLEQYTKSYRVRPTMAVGSGGLGKKDCLTVNIRGPLSHRLALLGSLRPERLLTKVDPNSFGRMELRSRHLEDFPTRDVVVRVVPGGTTDVIRLNTDTRTFFLEGYPSHNCIKDVDVLEEAYTLIRPIVTTHPNVSELHLGKMLMCRVCGKDRLRKRGRLLTIQGPKQRYQCKDCGAWRV